MKINIQDIPLYAMYDGFLFCPKCGCDELGWNEEIEFHNICCCCGEVIEIPEKNQLVNVNHPTETGSQYYHFLWSLY